MSLASRFRLPDGLTDEDMRVLRLAQRAAFEAKFLDATRVGAVASAISSAGCFVALPNRWAIWGLASAAAVGISLLAIAIAAKRFRMSGWIAPLNFAVGVLGAAVTGEAATYGLGVASPGLLVLLLIWLFGTVVIGMRPAHLLIAIGLDAVAYAAPSLARGMTQGMGLYVGIVAGAGAVFTLAALERRTVEARTLLTRRRKAQTNVRLAERTARLAAWSSELERQVDMQLATVLDRRRQVAMLERAVGEASKPIAGLAPSSAALPTPMLLPGHVVGGRARIIRPIASGGFGNVYLASDLATDAEVVLKVMRCTSETDASRKRRFVLEASAANAVAHRSIVRVLHVDISDEGWPYLLSERVDGVTLRWCLQANALTSSQVLAAARATADALVAIHAAGIVHRDLKPDNLMLQREPPGLKVLDFGISRWAESDEHGLTAKGEILGTVAYMAPEQIADGSRVSPAADVYALGLTLYECLAGEHPLAGLDLERSIEAHLGGKLPSLVVRAPLLDHRVVALVDSMLRRRPIDRPTAAMVRARLAEIVTEGETAERVFASLHLAPSSSRSSHPGGDDMETLGELMPRPSFPG